MAFCRNCGAQIKDGVKFCTDCGAATEVGSASAPEYEYNKVNQDVKATDFCPITDGIACP